MYSEVIRQSFATVAQEFNLTKKNCPGHTSFITDERLASKIKDGYYPFGYFTDGKLVGFASLIDMSNGVFEMNGVAVLPEYRRLGYRKSLLDFCKEKVCELGGNKITIVMWMKMQSSKIGMPRTVLPIREQNNMSICRLR
jgi:ribosomal protein S18 acetylase RimI-like enzyme